MNLQVNAELLRIIKEYVDSRVEYEKYRPQGFEASALLTSQAQAIKDRYLHAERQLNGVITYTESKR